MFSRGSSDDEMDLQQLAMKQNAPKPNNEPQIPQQQQHYQTIESALASLNDMPPLSNEEALRFLESIDEVCQQDLCSVGRVPSPEPARAPGRNSKKRPEIIRLPINMGAGFH